MQGNVRRARPSDLDQMVDLAEKKYLQYQAYQSVVWHTADSLRDTLLLHFERRLRGEHMIALVHDTRGVVDGFIIAELTVPAPVFEPGGYVCQVDEYMVQEPDDWDGFGPVLLKEVCREARRRGAVAVAVTTGTADQVRRNMLADAGFESASEWHIKTIAED